MARILSISPQNLQSKLNSKDIKVGLVKEIAKAINKDVYWILDIKGLGDDLVKNWQESEIQPSFSHQERKYLEAIIEEQRNNLKSKDIAINALQEALSLMKARLEEYGTSDFKRK